MYTGQYFISELNKRHPFVFLFVRRTENNVFWPTGRVGWATKSFGVVHKFFQVILTFSDFPDRRFSAISAIFCRLYVSVCVHPSCKYNVLHLQIFNLTIFLHKPKFRLFHSFPFGCHICFSQHKNHFLFRKTWATINRGSLSKRDSARRFSTIGVFSFRPYSISHLAPLSNTLKYFRPCFLFTSKIFSPRCSGTIFWIFNVIKYYFDTYR